MNFGLPRDRPSRPTLKPTQMLPACRPRFKSPSSRVSKKSERVRKFLSASPAIRGFWSDRRRLLEQAWKHEPPAATRERGPPIPGQPPIRRQPQKSSSSSGSSSWLGWGEPTCNRAPARPASLLRRRHRPAVRFLAQPQPADQPVGRGPRRAPRRPAVSFALSSCPVPHRLATAATARPAGPFFFLKVLRGKLPRILTPQARTLKSFAS